MGESFQESNFDVLVVEDEPEIRELISLHLIRNGFRVRECDSAESALRELENKSYALVVLDWMLPRASGIDVIGRMKKINSDIIVLMVTAKSEPEDIILGLESGADDYLTKPFEPNVLLARVKALLRRISKAKAQNIATIEDIGFDGLSINLKSYKVYLRDRELHLTPSELKLLISMLKSEGRVLTRDQLIDDIQGEDVNVTGRTIDTHVFGLRKKLDEWSDNIETIRGIGYRVKTEQ